MESPEKKQIKCKFCFTIFHLECILRVGRITIDNQVICNECWQKENSNQFYESEGRNYLNNIDPVNVNSHKSYPQNWNILNEMLKTSINKGLTSIPNINGQQAYNTNTNYYNASQNNFQSANIQNGNQMNFSQNLLTQTSHMNPHQLMILSQILKSEKDDSQNPAINSSFIKCGLNTNANVHANNMNLNPDLIKAHLLNQYLANLNKNKQPLPSQPGNFMNQAINNNNFFNFQENLNSNTKLFANSNQTLTEPQQMQFQQNPLNYATKQNNITQLNFFNNLFNISQMQSSFTNTMNSNPIYNNPNFHTNLKPNLRVEPTNNLLYQSFPHNKTQSSKNKNSNNLEFVGANSSLKTMLSTNNLQENLKLHIEDSLLYKNPEKYNIDTKCYERPQPRSLNVPYKLQNKIFSIWDFFYSFKSFLDPESKLFVEKDFDLEEFYHGIIQEEHFKKLALSLLNLFMMYSYLIDPTEFEFDKGLLLLRTLRENINSNLKQISINSWKEIFEVLTESKKFRLLVDDEVLGIKQKIKKISEKEEPNFQFLIEEKVSILFYLASSSMEITKIKDHIKCESEKKHNLLREKLSLKLEYKNKENRKKEIEKSEKFLKAAQKIEELTKKLDEIEQCNPSSSKILMKQKMEFELKRERYKSILKENIEIENVKDNILHRRIKIKIKLREIILNNERLIGQDVFKNNYYFFENDTKKIYVKRKNQASNLQTSNSPKEKGNFNLNNKQSIWFCYDEKETIELIISKLIDKGIRERKLKHKLKKILNKRMTFEENKILEIKSAPNSIVKDVLMMDATRESIKDVDDLGLAVEILKKLDEKFSEYLKQFSKQWETTEIQEKWVNIKYKI